MLEKTRVSHLSMAETHPCAVQLTWVDFGDQQQKEMPHGLQLLEQAATG